MTVSTQIGADITIPGVAGVATWTADLSTIKTFDTTGHSDDGAYTVSVTATDAAGNTVTTTQAFNVDTVTNVTYTSFTPDTLGLGTIGTNIDKLTDSVQPTFTGTTEKGDAVTVTLTASDLAHTVTVLPTVVSTDGTWSVQVPAASSLAVDGAYAIAVSAVDPAGNTASDSGSFTLDKTAPVATPVLETTSDSAGAGHTVGGWAGTAGLVGTNSDDLTKDTTPTFDITTGTAPNSLTSEPAGAAVLVEVYSGTTLVASSTQQTASDGTLTYQAPLLAAGNYSLHTTPTDIAGNVGPTVNLPFTIDTGTTVAYTGFTNDTAGAGTAGTTSDNLTLDPTPVFVGTAEVGDSVAVTLTGPSGTIETKTSISTDGHWSFQPTNALTTDGAYSIAVTATDAAGNTATDNTGGLTLDTVTNVAYTGLTMDTFGVGTTGTALDNLTKDTQPTFMGTAEVGDAVTVVLLNPHGATVQTTTVIANSSGDWSAPTLAPLTGGDGVYSLVITAVDPAGNSATALPANFTLDHTAPVATPVLETTSDSAGAGHTVGGWAGTAGLVGTNSDDLTKDTTPTFDITTGTAPNSLTSEPAGAAVLVEVYSGTTLVASSTQQTASDGTLTYQAPLLAAGNYSLHTTPTDIAGNTGAVSILPFTIDTATAVTYSGFTNDTAGAGTTGTTTDKLTFDTQPTYSGTAEAGDLVSVAVMNPSGTVVDTLSTFALADGSWSVATPVSGALTTNGAYTLVATATDAAGNTATAPGNFSLDTMAPVATPVLAAASDSAGGGVTTGTWAGPAGAVGTTSDDLTKDTTPTFDITTGTAPHSATSEPAGAAVLVQVYDSTGTIINVQTQTLQTDANGQVFFTVPGANALAPGNYTLHTTPTDIAGNVGSTASLPFTIDTGTTVAYTGFTNDTAGAGTAGTTSDNLTKDNEPVFSGTAEAGDAIAVTISGPSGVVETLYTTAPAGIWTLPAPPMRCRRMAPTRSP